MNLLFVCSKNQWRSPTGEQIYRKTPGIHTRSAGTAHSAKHVINKDDIKWADIIFPMEDKHLKRLKAGFPGSLKYKKYYVLDIPDKYHYMDPALIKEIQTAVDSILENTRLG